MGSSSMIGASGKGGSMFLKLQTRASEAKGKYLTLSSQTAAWTLCSSELQAPSPSSRGAYPLERLGLSFVPYVYLVFAVVVYFWF